ncbi:MAG: hypothetical protein ABIR54_08100 [Burkholderiaceae bacterium]
MTYLFACLLLALAGYAVFARRRHQRLSADCTAAFERVYAATSPRPAFEMAYSYGEPVFQVKFASKADMQAAADTNAAFLRDIDAICKRRGRKRQFKAERAVFFQHPTQDEPEVAHCCDTLRAQLGRTIAYSEGTRVYGLKTSIVGTPPLAIACCPWCGSRLPPPPQSGA